MNKTTRYQVNQELLVITLKSPKSYWGTYCPYDLSTVDSFTVTKLKVVEHKKVPGLYDEEPQYDGFRLFDEQGNTWFNQWPRASLTGNSARTFRREYEDYNRLADSAVVNARLLTDFYTEVKKSGRTDLDQLILDIDNQVKLQHNKILLDETVTKNSLDAAGIKHFVLKDIT